jgi:carbon-monoxide dehydrogenase large subunit
MATARVLGASIKRREDPRFITGKGNYTDDLKLPGLTHAVFVRSPHANAKIRRIDTSKAAKSPGVVAIFTGKDMTGVNSLPCGWLLPELKIPPHMPLATDAAHYVGDPVAIVIADSQAARSTRSRRTTWRSGGRSATAPPPTPRSSRPRSP